MIRLTEAAESFGDMCIGLILQKLSFHCFAIFYYVEIMLFYFSVKSYFLFMHDAFEFNFVKCQEPFQ